MRISQLAVRCPNNHFHISFTGRLADIDADLSAGSEFSFMCPGCQTRYIVVIPRDRAW